MKNILYIILPLIIFSACHSSKKEDAKVEATSEAVEESSVDLTTEQIKTLGIETAEAEKRKMKATISLNGLINVLPQFKVSINAPFGGFVKNLSVQEGSPLSQGQTISFIENPEYIQLQQDYMENKSQLPFLESEYQRQLELSEEQVNAKKSLQKAKADLDLLKAKLAGQKAKLKMLGIDILKLEAGEISSGVSLRAPINGIVTAINTNPGAFIGNTDVILEMIDTKHLYAELAVYEKDLSKLRIGQKVNLKIAGEDKVRKGSIKLLGSQVNEDRTLHVYCQFEQADVSLRPGMFLKAEVETSDYEAIAVPENAIVSLDGKNYVFTSSNGSHFDMTQIEKGINSDGYTEIISGMNEKQKIVTKGAFRMLAILKNSGEE